jgi:hypothetical protein
VTAPQPFEEPAKARMRARCEVAIDQAGHELVASPVKVRVAAASGLQGAVLGDLQSLDGEQQRYCYYLRPQTDKVLPKWLANLARQSHDMADIKLYVVAEDPSPEFQRSCRSAGAGVLALNEENTFAHVVRYDDLAPEDPDAAFVAALDALRRRMEDKLELGRASTQTRLEKAREATAGMPDEVADGYTHRIEQQYSAWTRWGDDMSQRLDAVYATRDVDALTLLTRDVGAGPVLDDDE